MNDYYFDIPEIKITKQLRNLPELTSNMPWNNYGAKLFDRSFIPGQNPIPVHNVYKQFKSIDLLGRASLLLVKPGGKVEPHIDAFRQGAINIPLSANWNKSYTVFYTVSGIKKLFKKPNIYFEAGKLPQFRPGGAYPLAKEVTRIQYNKAVCINTAKIHGVINESNEDRYVLSISIRPPYTFEQLKEAYFSGKLI
jgi:hypothetical protein